VDGGFDVKPGEVVMLENSRCNKGEKKCNEELSQKMAALCDVWVMDAFGTAHRAEATTYGMGKYAKIACAGPCVGLRTRSADQGTGPSGTPDGGHRRRFQGIHQTDRARKSLGQGRSTGCRRGIANTFLLASGKKIGKSLAEHDLVDQAKAVMAKVKVPLPTDVVCAKEFSATAQATVKSVDELPTTT
jgi:phosphoglycerate kinase (EC 2.7.2.3)